MFLTLLLTKQIKEVFIVSLFSTEKMFHFIILYNHSIYENIKEGLDDYFNSKRQMLMGLRRNLTS